MTWRTLLEEARLWVAASESVLLLRNGIGWSERKKLLDAIDAALAEPVEVAEMAALYHIGLSERIRPGSEAAPWVIEAVKLVERERDEARAEVERAYKRGAEAMREAASRKLQNSIEAVDGFLPDHTTELLERIQSRIRALPVPEDKS